MPDTPADLPAAETALLRVRGRVQGVGYRPFVWQIARARGLTGWVKNDAEGVLILASGPDLAGFARALQAEAPPLAQVDRVERTATDLTAGPGFDIVASGPAGARTQVTPDAATCPDCAAEIRGTGRRRGYAFTNCTNCGPRLTIVTGLPYDRARTSMAAFPMCPDCAAEYADPGDRRFHAQPVACPACGPRLWLEADHTVSPGDPIQAAAARLLAGEILAVKGLGGVHLACLARDAGAVARLRERKRRPAKPLALMGTGAMIAAHARLDDAALTLLRSPAAPIVLLPMAGTPLPEAVAPGMVELGWMLPYTPLHHLLLEAVGAPLVMTSANVSGAPQVIGNAEAREKLGGIADAFLLHDREIARRLDDSVERMTPVGPMVLRRARGRVPGMLTLPEGFADAPPILAYGGQMKGAICLARDGQAMLSHHLGDLDDPETRDAFLAAEHDYCALFEVTPARLACDRHPDYAATLHAGARAAELGLPLIPVQHHHAHLAAVLGETGWARDAGPVAGIVLDGTGLGPDGTIWGGELLVGDYAGVTRAAHLVPAPLPGGDRAAREPWRNALVRLDALGLAEVADRLFPDAPRDALRAALAAGIGVPLSSSAGRLFDAAAALLGLCPMAQSYEGEAAMRLEALAQGARPRGYAMAQAGAVLDPGPVLAAMVEDLAQGIDPGAVAAGFQAALAQGLAAAARRTVEAGAARAVALSGGCFQNPALLAATLDALTGLDVRYHTRVPANDGGLALGQVLVAAVSA